MKVRCKHCIGVRKVTKLDGKTGSVLKGEWWWFADCDLYGDEEEVGVDCGKGHCRAYEQEEKGSEE